MSNYINLKDECEDYHENKLDVHYCANLILSDGKASYPYLFNKVNKELINYKTSKRQVKNNNYIKLLNIKKEERNGKY